MKKILFTGFIILIVLIGFVIAVERIEVYDYNGMDGRYKINYTLFNANNFTGTRMNLTGNISIADTISIQDSDHTLKIGSDTFDGLAEEAFVFDHSEEHELGTIAFMITNRNKTIMWNQVGRNNSAGLWGSSLLVGRNVVANDNFSRNLTQASDCLEWYGLFGLTPRVICDSSDGADAIIQGDLHVWNNLFIGDPLFPKSLQLFGSLTANLFGDDAVFFNGSIHNLIPTTFTSGFEPGDLFTILNTIFEGTISPFINLDVSPEVWFATSSALCGDGQCANADGSSGSADITMTTNISTLNVNETELNFVYSLVGLIGADNFRVETNNFTGSGWEVQLTDTGTETTIPVSIDLGETYSNLSEVGLRFVCDVTQIGRTCFVDTVKINGTFTADTTANVNGFDTEFCGADGSRDVNGNCNVGIRWDAELAQWIIAGTLNATGTIVGGISGSGTTNNWAKFISSTSIGNAPISDDGSLISMTLPLDISGDLNVTGDINISGNSTASFYHGDGSQLTGIVSGLWTNVSDVATYDGDINVTGNSTLNDVDFNGGWLNNGLSIIGGDIFVQTLYAFNITSLNVTEQNLTITDDLNIGGNLIFNLGEIIDNLVNGWIRITGSLNVTENIMVGQNLSFTDGDVFSNSSSLFYNNGSTDLDLAVTGNSVTMIDKYDTGWISRSDWTNVHLGSDSSKNVDSNVTHNLDASLSELEVHVLISTDGTDANAHEVGYDTLQNTAGNGFGITVFGVDDNNIKVQTSTLGFTTINDAGAIQSTDTEDWYYRIVVLKPHTGTITLTNLDLENLPVIETYNTGWISRSDWTNVHMGSDNTKNADSNVTHNLDAVLSDLDVSVFISTDGTDANSFEVGDSDFSQTGAASFGANYYQVDSNNIIVQTGTSGLIQIQSDGTVNGIGTEDWYYKIVVKKHSSGTTSALITKTGTTLSAGTSGDDIDIPRKSYDTGWISRSDWTNVHLGTDDTKNTDSNVTHNLDTPLSDLLVKVLVSTDGTDANGFEVGTMSQGTGNKGVVFFEVDSDNLIIQTADTGMLTLDSNGGVVGIDTDDWYYKIKVFKLG